MKDLSNNSTISVKLEVIRQYRGKALWIALAVLFDAEGCIGLSKVHATSQYVPALTVFNTDIEWLEAWRDRLGRGIVYTRRVQDTEKHEQSGTWLMKKRSDAIYILKRIIPYLAVKKEQAQLLLSFFEDRPQKQTHLGEQELVRREGIYQRMRTLNKKGPSESVETKRRISQVESVIVPTTKPLVELGVNDLVN